MGMHPQMMWGMQEPRHPGGGLPFGMPVPHDVPRPMGQWQQHPGMPRMEYPGGMPPPVVGRSPPSGIDIPQQGMMMPGGVLPYGIGGEQPPSQPPQQPELPQADAGSWGQVDSLQDMYAGMPPGPQPQMMPPAAGAAPNADGWGSLGSATGGFDVMGEVAPERGPAGDDDADELFQALRLYQDDYQDEGDGDNAAPPWML